MPNINILREKLKVLTAHKPKLIAGLVVVLALSLPFVINQVLQQQDLRQRADSAPPISFALSPITGTFNIGNTFNVELGMSAGTNDIGSLEYTLQYDATKLEFTDGGAGNTTLSVANKTGSTGSYTFTWLNTGMSPVTSDVIVHKMQFKALAAGTATVSIKTDVKATTKGIYTYVPVTYSSTTNGSYTIQTANASATATPTPSGTVRYCGGNDHVSCEIGLYSCYTNSGNNVGKTCVSTSGENSTYNCVQCVYVTPTPGNATPTPTTAADVPICGVSTIPPATGPAPLKVTLHGSGSVSPQGTNGVEGYEWDFDGNGTWDSSVQLDYIEHIYSDSGTYKPKFRIKGQKGGYSDICNYGYDVVVGTANPTPTSTPVPTVTVAPNETAVTLALTLPGIGKVSGDNTSPKRATRQATVIVYDSSNTAVTTEKMGTVTYNSATGRYEGIVGLGNSIATQSGSYIVKVKLDNTLLKRLPGIVTITKNQTNTTSAAALVSGDINQDNTLGIEDYTSVLACYNNASGCTQQISVLADINDNGEVVGDTDDYQILQRGFAIRNGD